MKPCSVRLYLVVDHTKVLWLRPCFGIVVCYFGEQVFKIHVRPKQASVPLRHSPLLCQHSVVEGLWEGGELGESLGCHCTAGDYCMVSHLCVVHGRDLRDNYFVAPMVEVFPY